MDDFVEKSHGLTLYQSLRESILANSFKLGR